MHHRNRIKRVGIVCAVLGVVLVSSCSKNSVKPPPISATDKVSQANAALETILFALSHTDPQRPSDLDFRTPEQLYREALAADPTNEDANFGAGVLGLLVLTSDAEANAAFDEWKTYLASHTPFEVNSGALSPLGVPIAPTGSRSALALPFDLVPLSLVAESRASLTGGDPQIGRIQAILSDRVLPRLVEAATRLDVVGRDASYRFIVTPRMQGDDRAHPIEIDQTDILALAAAARLLAATVHVAVAYELGFAAYDSASLVHALTPGSGWLALRTGGADHLSAAGASLLSSIDGVDASINALLAETDDQSDDLIKVGNGRADIESLRVHLPQLRQALTTGFTRVDDWDRDGSTADTPLRIRVGALFDAPVPDWKTLLPPYAASVTRRARRVVYPYEYGGTRDTVTIALTDFYFGYYTYTFSNGAGSETFFGTEEVRGPLRRVVRNLFDEARARPDWNGYFSGTSNFSDSLQAGHDSIEVSWFQEYSTAPSTVFVPVITWDAQAFDEWQWPDPTLHGLLPELTSASDLNTLFGISSSNWTQELVLDWTTSGPLHPARTSPPRVFSSRSVRRESGISMRAQGAPRFAPSRAALRAGSAIGRRQR